MKPAQFRVNRLETRPAPANLSAALATFVEGVAPHAPTTPEIGQGVEVELTWTATGLPASSTYSVRVSIDGVPVDRMVTTSGTSLTRFLSGWYAGPDNHNDVAESDETDNTYSFVYSP